MSSRGRVVLSQPIFFDPAQQRSGERQVETVQSRSSFPQTPAVRFFHSCFPMAGCVEMKPGSCRKIGAKGVKRSRGVRVGVDFEQAAVLVANCQSANAARELLRRLKVGVFHRGEG